MKKIFVTMAICWLFHSNSALAQSFNKRSAEEKAEFFTRQMTKDLSLEDSVIKLVYAINLATSKKFDSLYKEGKNEDTRKGAALIYAFRNEELRKVLSTKAYLKFDDLERERREKRMKEKEKDQH